jgi:hypothetical protein
VGSDDELHMLLSFPGPLGAMCALGPYPRIAEFRGMLSGLKEETVKLYGNVYRDSYWDGESFFGYIVKEGESAGYWFREHRSGITLGMKHEQWPQVQELFKKAWSNTELNAIWQRLIEEYGEL